MWQRLYQTVQLQSPRFRNRQITALSSELHSFSHCQWSLANLLDRNRFYSGQGGKMKRKGETLPTCVAHNLNISVCVWLCVCVSVCVCLCVCVRAFSRAAM